VNVDDAPRPEVGPGVWEQREMRLALARRDLSTVYRLLQRVGISQRRIAALTGQSPSEVHEILNGRQVMAYDVLARIADGLGVPRGYLGLAYDESTETAVEMVAGSCSTQPDEQEEVRRLLAHAANVTMGTAVSQVATWWQPVDRTTAPVPGRVGLADVCLVQAVTRVMRTLDYRFGGAACRDAVVAQTAWAQQLLAADHTDEVGVRLRVAVADMHNLAGWTSFDVGLYSSARRHFARALEQARSADDASLIANVLYRMGRLHLHRGWIRDALRFFQLAQIAAQDSGCELTVAMLCANEAWAYALLGDAAQALKSIGRSQDEFARADPADTKAWVRFFGAADLNASAGVVYVSLPSASSTQLDNGIGYLLDSLRERGQDMARSRIFELTALAAAHLRAGDTDCAVRVGREALGLAAAVRSVRILDRMEPLQTAAARYGERNTDLRDLTERIATLRAG
jgi:transcriptional regulator with XRE-family HTH domain/tetratricopeptide (TPR) repeat protein